MYEIILILKNTIINVIRDGDSITVTNDYLLRENRFPYFSVGNIFSPNLCHYNWWCHLKFSFAHTCVILQVYYTIISCVAERCYKIYKKINLSKKDFDTALF